MKQKTVTLSKTIKLPVKDIQFSNRVVSATIEYEGEVDNKKAWEEVNQLIQMGHEDEDADWIRGKE